MKVGFLSNQLDNRGTGNAMYDYADYNQRILGNESHIFTFVNGKHHPTMMEKYCNAFAKVEIVTPESLYRKTAGLDVLYHIKYGNDDGMRVNPMAKYAVHSVFTNTPHGDKYATISKWLANVGEMGGRTPFVPHIINLPVNDYNHRTAFGIGKDDLVFGRYGGYDTFDISWVWDVIEKVLFEREDVWFLFANTEPGLQHPRVIYRPELTRDVDKTFFINTCDYMLHARHRGETFGIAVGEFASKGRPIITYYLSGEQAHFWELGTNGMYYSDQFDLYKILMEQDHYYWKPRFAYTQYTPDKVMAQFKKVFLED